MVILTPVVADAGGGDVFTFILFVAEERENAVRLALDQRCVNHNPMHPRRRAHVAGRRRRFVLARNGAVHEHGLEFALALFSDGGSLEDAVRLEVDERLVNQHAVHARGNALVRIRDVLVVGVRGLDAREVARPWPRHPSRDCMLQRGIAYKAVGLERVEVVLVEASVAEVAVEVARRVEPAGAQLEAVRSQALHSACGVAVVAVLASVMLDSLDRVAHRGDGGARCEKGRRALQDLELVECVAIASSEWLDAAQGCA